MDTAWRYDTFSCDILDLNAIQMLKYRTRKKIDWASQLGSATWASSRYCSSIYRRLALATKVLKYTDCVCKLKLANRNIFNDEFNYFEILYLIIILHYCNVVVLCYKLIILYSNCAIFLVVTL